MKIARITFAFTGLMVATAILGVSLASSAPTAYSAGDKIRTNDKQFYLDGDILPDHVLYPLIMVADKIKLESSSPTEQIYLSTTYANLRLDATIQLLHKDSTSLALTTLTKSQKYLLNASQMSLEGEASQKTLNHVLKTVQFHVGKHGQIKESFSESEKSIIDMLDMELEVYMGMLEERLAE